MSDDIVKRLRSGTDWWRSDCEIRMQAADEIERLRKALKGIAENENQFPMSWAARVARAALGKPEDGE